MGWFNSFAGFVPALLKTPADEQTLRQKHGFADFDADMQRLRDYDPATELTRLSQEQAQEQANDKAQARKPGPQAKPTL